ncbi:hypothetical protein AB0O76_41985 [Streptomyces sp. NPDC086554]|uniref:hypothetical protein n=1 Tax=Streptomyces sp. NPDC086554 TaxID=3154864 RepID=UPI00341941C2
MSYRDVATRPVAAAVGAGYAASGSLAGGLLTVVAPSTAILAGVGLTLVLTVVGVLGEVKPSSSGEVKPSPSGDVDVPERAPVRGGGDAESRL